MGVRPDSDYWAITISGKPLTPLDSAQNVTRHRLTSAPQSVLQPDKPLGQKTAKRGIAEPTARDDGAALQALLLEHVPKAHTIRRRTSVAAEWAAPRGWKQPRPIESPPKPKICPLDIAVARRLLEKRLIRPIARLISKLAFKNTVALRQHKKRNDKRWQHQTASEPRTNIAQTFAERVQFVRRRAAAPPWPQRPSHLFVAPLAQ